MKNFTILLIAILPVYIIALYVYNKDHDKESKKLLAKLLLYGMLSCIPAIFLELFLGSFFGSEEAMDIVTKFFYVFTSIAFVEEICKWFFVYKIAYKHPEFDHIYDAIVYSVFVALGFALFENIFYVFLGGLTIGLLRAITAVPGHAINGIIMGEYLGLAKKYGLRGNKQKSKRAIYLSIIMPTITHGIYDYCLLTGNLIMLVLFLIFLLYMYIYSFKTIKRLSNVKNNLNNNNNLVSIKYCPRCEKRGVGKYCTYCGTPLITNNTNNINKINRCNNLTR